ncbi:MAG: hypothetical protein ACI90V_013836, partial [Bacillariaceae sp.]
RDDDDELVEAVDMTIVRLKTSFSFAYVCCLYLFYPFSILDLLSLLSKIKSILLFSISQKYFSVMHDARYRRAIISRGPEIINAFTVAVCSNVKFDHFFAFFCRRAHVKSIPIDTIHERA